jgi:hypothetical protein
MNIKKTTITIILVTAMILSHITLPINLPSVFTPSSPTDSGNSTRTSSNNPNNPNNPNSPDNPAKPQQQAVSFSHQAGFYNQAFTLTLTPDGEFEGGEIYYTTSDDASGVAFPRNQLSRHDGGLTPTTDSALYTAPINVSVPQQVNVFTVSAIAVLNGEASAPVTHSFIRGENVQSRFEEDFLVFSLYSDANGLYDLNKGILVPGIDRDEWTEDYRRINGGNPNPWNWDDELPPTSPANFNRRGRGSEREVHVEMFDSRGQRHIAQRAGMRVKGGWSRGTFPFEQKTLELYARNSYGDANSFIFPLFGEHHARDGSLIHEYRRFRLRNGGTDREQSYLRDELSHELYKQAGYADVQQHTPGIVYLNGEYYGLVWLKTPRTEHHWARVYGGEADNFHHLGGDERGRVGCVRIGCGRVLPGVGTTGGRTPANNPDRCSPDSLCNRPDCEDFWSDLYDLCEPFGECRAVADWQEIRRLVRGSSSVSDEPYGLDNDDAFAEFIERVDIDNLIRYYALGMYIANVDWPANNIEMWRYFPDSEESDLHPHLADGKWRFIAQDLEFGYGLWGGDDTMGNRSDTRATDNTLHALINRTGVPGGGGHFNATDQTFIIPALVRRSEMRERLANAFIDLMEGAFEPTNALAVFGKLQSQIQEEHIRMLSRNRRISEIDRNDNPGNWPDWNAVDRSHGQIRDFLRNRPNAKLNHIESELGLRASDRSRLTFTNGNGGDAVMHTRPVAEGQTVTGNYYNNTTVIITAKPYTGYAVDYWTVDGERRNGDSVTVSISSAVTVEVVYEQVSDTLSGERTVEVSRFGYSQIQTLGRDGKWRIKGRADTFVPHEPSVPEIPTEAVIGTSEPAQPQQSPQQTVGGGSPTATPTGNGAQISNIPENGAWTVTIPFTTEWPPTGGPWGAPDGVSFVHSGGTLTISGNGRHGWGDNWTVTWGYW